MGHRFWPQRAKRIVLARNHRSKLSTLRKWNAKDSRKWLVENVNGLGLKESSHFLRNIDVNTMHQDE